MLRDMLPASFSHARPERRSPAISSAVARSSFSLRTRTRLSSSSRGNVFPNQHYVFARENSTQEAASRFLASVEFLQRI